MTSHKLTGDLMARALLLQLDGPGPRLRVDQLAFEPFEVTLGDVACSAHRAAVADLTRGPEGVVSAASASLTGVRLSRAGVTVVVDSIELPRGLHYRTDTGELEVPELVVVGVAVAVDDLLAIGHTPAPDAAAGPDATADAGPDSDAGSDDSPGKARKRRFTLLDALDGHLHVDLFLDVTIPVLGRRSETHEFRVPISGGTFDYKELEGDANWLARSVLDIEIIDGKLALEKDLPLVPFDNKVLMAWPLEPDELELARRHRARLRTLLDWELPARDPDQKLSVTLHEIAARNIDIALGIAGTAQFDLGERGRVRIGDHGDGRGDDSDNGDSDNGGGERRPGVVGLSVTGELHHAIGAKRPATTLHGAVASLSGALDDVLLGPFARLSAGRVDLDSVHDVVVTCHGFLPHRLAGTVDRLAVTRLRARLLRPGLPGRGADDQAA